MQKKGGGEKGDPLGSLGSPTLSSPCEFATLLEQPIDNVANRAFARLEYGIR